VCTISISYNNKGAVFSCASEKERAVIHGKWLILQLLTTADFCGERFDEA
jgi:hypothetical protein